MKKATRHTLKWAFASVTVIVLFVLWFVPFAKWLFVDHTLSLYKETEEYFAAGDKPSQQYQGTITDTLFYPSATVKGKKDTVLHRQSVLLAQKEPETDARPRREEVGVFGDSAGLFNAFFSFLAFLGVIITLYLQSRKDSQEKQNGARVLFEQEFFAMVGMLENIVSHLRFVDQENFKFEKLIDDVADDLMKRYYPQVVRDVPDNDTSQEETKPIEVEGRDVFRYLYVDRKNYSVFDAVNKDKDIRATMESLEYGFDGTLDHYFRYLYRILKHIDESELLNRLDDPKKEREYYAHLLRAQLSNYELKMLFYNGLLGENPHTIKVLIERYTMFNNLRAWELGKFQKEYYQAILDEEVVEDPADIDPQTTYSVRAFLDEKKLEELRGNTEHKQWKFCEWIKKKCCSKPTGSEPVAAEVAVDAAVVEPAPAPVEPVPPRVVIRNSNVNKCKANKGSKPQKKKKKRKKR